MNFGTAIHRGLLLEPDELLSAIQGDFDNGTELAARARQLGALYREWVSDPAAGLGIRREIGAVVVAIDAEVSGRIPRPLPGVPRGTESVGGVMARVAEAWACAWWTLHNTEDDLQRHRAWDHLAEMRQGYQDFIRLVFAGLIALPKSWPGLGWPGIDVGP